MEKSKTKQKNLNLTQSVTELFERFCGERGIAQGQAASASLLMFTRVDAETREQWMLEFGQFEKKRIGANSADAQAAAVGDSLADALGEVPKPEPSRDQLPLAKKTERRRKAV